MTDKTKLYVAPVTNIPAPERNLSTVHVELQEGCPYNRCSYCLLYKETPFRNKGLQEVKDNIDMTFDVLNYYLQNPHLGSNLRRIKTSHMGRVHFIRKIHLGGADVLAYPTDQLLEIITYAKQKIESVIAEDDKIKKISCQASTRSMYNTSKEDIEALVSAGLNVVYWGVESGSNNVLEHANKQSRKHEILEIAEKIHGTGVMASVNIMPGLGGIKYYDEHVQETVEVLAAIRPRWVTFLSLESNGTKYEEILRKESDNRFLTPHETSRQMLEICLGLEERLKNYEGECSFSSAGPSLVTVANNPVIFKHTCGRELVGIYRLGRQFGAVNEYVRSQAIKKIAIEGGITASVFALLLGIMGYLLYMDLTI